MLAATSALSSPSSFQVFSTYSRRRTTSASVRSFTRVAGLIPVFSRASLARALPMP